jgi:P4 family phage/plasmid primase-like protien
MNTNLPKGLKVFPVSSKRNEKDKKEAFWVEPIEKATDNPEKIQEWLDNGHLLAAPVGYRWGIFGIDIDPAEGGLETVEQFESQYGETAPTWFCTTPHGGFHPIYRIPSGTSDQFHNCNLGMGYGVKISDNSYIIVGGNGYTADNDTVSIKYPPAYLVDLLLEKQKRTAVLSKKVDMTAEEEVEFAENCMARISRRRADDYDDWIKIGMALSTMQDQKKALKLFHKFSRQSYKYDEAKCEQKFNTFRREEGENRLTLGTLYHFAEEDNPSQVKIGGQKPPKTNDAPSIAPNKLLGKSSLTDTGNAERLIYHYGDILRYNKSFNWIIWDGQRWRIDAPDSHKYAQDTARSIYDEAGTIENNRDLSDAWAKWAYQSLGSYHLSKMLEEAEPHLFAETSEFDDNHHMLLNVKNGILDLKEHVLLPHDPKYFLTHQMNASFEPAADCPNWKEFLEMIFPDAEVRKFVQKAVGFSLTGNSDERALFFLWGEDGKNGKSTFIRQLLSLFGDYGKQTDIEAIMDSRRGGLTPLNEDFYNARFVATNEINKNHRFNESTVKALTGNDLITCNPKHRKPFSFPPTHKLWIFGNKKPKGGEDDDAFWDRMNLIAFDQQIPENIRRPMEQVLADFDRESSGILNWALEGLAFYMQEGLKRPEKVLRDTQSYQMENDWFTQFIEEECELVEGGRVLKDILFTKYNSFLHDNGEQSISKRGLALKLQKVGVVVGGDGKKFYLGIRLGNEHPSIGIKRIPNDDDTEL